MTAFGFAKTVYSVDLIEDGAFCHFRDADGELLYLPGAIREDESIDESKRIGAYVRSVDSKTYEKFLDEVTRKSMAKNRKAKTEAQKVEAVFQQLKDERPANFAVLVTRLVNTDPDHPGEFEPTREQKLEIVGLPEASSFVDQVINFANDKSNYPAPKAEAKADAGNADAA